MDTLILVFFGLVGVGLMLSTVVLMRDYGARGLLALASGIGLLLAAIFWLPPILAHTGDAGEALRLRAELTAAHAKAEDAAREAAAAAVNLETEVKAKSKAEKELDETLTSIGRDVDRLQQQYSEAQSTIYLDSATLSTASATQAEPPERIERIRSMLGAMGQLKARQAISQPQPVQLSAAPQPQPVSQ